MLRLTPRTPGVHVRQDENTPVGKQFQAPKQRRALGDITNNTKHKTPGKENTPSSSVKPKNAVFVDVVPTQLSALSFEPEDIEYAPPSTTPSSFKDPCVCIDAVLALTSGYVPAPFLTSSTGGGYLVEEVHSGISDERDWGALLENDSEDRRGNNNSNNSNNSNNDDFDINLDEFDF